MADNKKYYYLKLKENFYDSEELIILQNMPDGYLYSDILMKLYLRSLKNNGKLMFKDVIPYTPTALAQVVRHQVGTVEKAIEIFKQLGLIEVLDNGAIYMLDIQNFIGESSSEADRKRKYREEIKQQKTLLGQMSDKCPDKSTPEIEIEKEININTDKMSEDFETIWKEYPNKSGKSKAFTYYKGWLKGTKEYCGKKIKLTNKQMWLAVKEYADECEEQKREMQYIKMGSTFFNSSIVEYVEKVERENG